jgi:predicted unusual protein kinase regulating ubiquinone biosynthesis (AarF/ABC1/UbiB family)
MDHAFVKPLYFGLKLARHYRSRDVTWMKRDIIRMGPAYVKIGQFVAARTDVFPKYITDELSDLHDNVTPIEYDIVHQLLMRENALDLFETVEQTPLSTASIGQVHIATLKEHPDVPVVLKIQKPNVREEFERDFEALDKGIRFLLFIAPRYRVLKDMYAIVEQSKRSVFQELDFENERQNLNTMRRAFENTGTNVRVPRVVGRMCTKRLLVMEYVPARRIRKGDDMSALTKAIVVTGMKHGIIHGDLHPGNVGVCSEESFVLFDCGAVIQFEPALVKALFSSFITKNSRTILNVVLTNKLVYIDREPRGRIQLERAIEYVLSYLDDVDIQRFFTQIKTDPLLGNSQLDFHIDPDMFLLSRTITLLEGTCKEYQEQFTYNDVLFSMISDLNVLSQYIDVDVIIQRGLIDLLQQTNRKS